MEPIRILYVNGGIMSRGGIESYMMNYYRHLDRSKIQIDFIVHGFEKGAYDDEIKLLGGKIYNVPIKSKDYYGNLNALKEIFISGDYKIVHSHMDAMSMVVLKVAKKCEVPIRIAHSHNTQHLTRNFIQFLLNEYARKRICKYATHYFACSELAGRWLFGNKRTDQGEVNIIKNAIDIDKFIFNSSIRKEIRDEYNLNDNLVVGHVGRFDFQKNHMFMLDIFYELVKIHPNSKLVLVGDGNLRKEIEYKISNLNLKKQVILVGVREDVNRIFNGLDVFCLPSLFEGMPVVSVEAQANGLISILSNTITKESKINDNVYYLDLNSSPRKWAEYILDKTNKNTDRHVNIKLFIDKGYSIEREADKLQNIYLNFERTKNESFSNK